MSIIELLLKELNEEGQITRKMLERVPNDKYDWKPHQKSMTLMQLTTHIAELPGWITMALNTAGLDFAAQPYEHKRVNNTAECLLLLTNLLKMESLHWAKRQKQTFCPNGRCEMVII